MDTGNMHRNLVKFNHEVFDLCERTDGQTDTLIAILGSPARQQVTRNVAVLSSLVAWHSGRTSVSLAGELSLSCARPAADW